MISLDEYSKGSLSEFGNLPFGDNDRNDYSSNSVDDDSNLNFIIDKQMQKIISNSDNISVHDSKSSTAETKKYKIFNIEKVKEKKKENILQKKRGRKKENEKSEGKHNKNAEDNMIIKIKIEIFKYARDIINLNLPKNKEIIKLNHKEIRNLQIDINKQMVDKTLKQLFSEINISEKFKNIKYKDHNKKLISEIYEGIIKAEKVKKILDLTFFELLEIFKKKKEEIISEKKLQKLNLLVGKKEKKESGYERFIKKLKEKKESEEYISKISSLIFKYKDWFDDKKGRK